MQNMKACHASLYIIPIWVIQGTSLTSLVSLHAQEACLACWLFAICLQPVTAKYWFTFWELQNITCKGKHSSDKSGNPLRLHYSLHHRKLKIAMAQEISLALSHCCRKSKNQLPWSVMRKWLHTFHYSFVKTISVWEGRYSVTQSQTLSKFGRILLFLFPGMLNGIWTQFEAQLACWWYLQENPSGPLLLILLAQVTWLPWRTLRHFRFSAVLIFASGFWASPQNSCLGKASKGFQTTQEILSSLHLPYCCGNS